ncbi:MAG TPA: 2-hydroxychromene-2-carboxylate isomerase [Reyranella sp.]|nr:2-hydroxychromene-2-carboxylate isomerase [Reyranella sp.]
MPHVEFQFDFGSPNAYLSHLLVPGIEKRTGVKFDYRPVLLGGVYKLTGNRAPSEAFAGIKNKLEYQRLEMDRFIRQHGITRYKHNPFFPVNTLAIMRGAFAAKKLGLFERYVDEVYGHMWAEPKKLDDPAVLKAALLESNLPADKLFELVQTQEIKDALMAETQRAVDKGAFGSPSFLVGGDLYFGKDRLRDVEEAIAAAK